MEVTDSENARIAGCGVGQSSATNYVVRDDDAADARETDSPSEVIGGRTFIGVNEGKVKR